MEKMPAQANQQPSRREIFGKAGRIIIPTLATFQVSTLKVRASGSLDMPAPRPGF
jgi:hypothetical protein